MALVPKQKKDFTLKVRDSIQHGENVVFIQGGSVVLGSKWVFFPDLRIDIKAQLEAYVSATSRRLFNNFNDILYVLFVLNSTGQIEVIPSVSYNKRSYGDVKTFPDLSGKMPLFLVRLVQDGSSDLKAFKPLQLSDVEMYEGYGNFTLKGPKGPEGYQGVTGIMGVTGYQGITGASGVLGVQGTTGLVGEAVKGITGPAGPDGLSLPAFIVDR